uniref:Uncharacterized protein n=1 Tax=Helianthus annuus TaxID=4232 RepID=A0A251SVQ0_HELAN
MHGIISLHVWRLHGWLPADVRKKRAERIRQSRWLWIRLVLQGEKTLEAGGLFSLSVESLLNKGDWKGKEWRKHGDIMALEFNRVALDVTGES